MPFRKINKRIAFCDVVFRYPEHIAPGFRHSLIHHQLERRDGCYAHRQFQYSSHVDCFPIVRPNVIIMA